MLDISVSLTVIFAVDMTCKHELRSMPDNVEIRCTEAVMIIALLGIFLL